MSLTALRRRAARVVARGDAGVTLMELVVAMALSTVLGAMTLAIFVQVNNSSSSSTDRSISTSEASVVMQAWPAYLRVSDGTSAGSINNRFEWLTPNDMLFYANLYNRPAATPGAEPAHPTMIWLRLDSAKSLVEEQFAWNASANSPPTACRILTDSKRSPVTAGVLFTPYDVAAHTMFDHNLGQAPTAAAGCQPLPVTPPSRSNHPDSNIFGNLQNVASVGIDFTVHDSKNTHPLDFSAIVTLPIPQPVQIPGT